MAESAVLLAAARPERYAKVTFPFRWKRNTLLAPGSIPSRIIMPACAVDWLVRRRATTLPSPVMDVKANWNPSLFAVTPCPPPRTVNNPAPKPLLPVGAELISWLLHPAGNSPAAFSTISEAEIDWLAPELVSVPVIVKG